MKIIYLGATYGTSAQRAIALRRLGHKVVHLDPQNAIPSSRWVTSLNVRTGYRLFERRVSQRLLHAMGAEQFDVAWIDGGAQLGPRFHGEIRRRGIPIISYNLDDPFGTRDFRKWDLYKCSVRYHDATVVVRKENILEARSHGARKVLHVFRSYDPVAHSAQSMPFEEQQRWNSEISFVGSWMSERGPFLRRLLELGVPLTIWGDRWRKASQWEKLRPAVRGPGLHSDDYVKAIQCSKVALGLLSVGNRDLHTQRSAEIPFIGGSVFCAERTTEHLAMYREGEEALFWSSPDECAAKCLRVLADGAYRERLAAAAQKRVVQMGLSNDEVLGWILDTRSVEATEIERSLSRFSPRC